MCAIGGFCSFETDYTQTPGPYLELLTSMHQVQSHRGPDGHGVFLDSHIGLSHARLSIIDLDGGSQPMQIHSQGLTWAIVYNGELYNTKELKAELISCGHSFQSHSDTEVILRAFIQYGPLFLSRLNGIFAFAIWSPDTGSLYLCRDRSGVKPLFYTFVQKELFFSSEIKGLFACPDINAKIDKNGLNEIFSVGPARTNGCGVFQGIHEVRPGCFLTYQNSRLTEYCYWKLVSYPHQDDEDTTLSTVSRLVIDAIHRQMVSDVPICTFLSGGLDSSLISAICAKELKQENKTLATFSFDFTGNEKNFQSNAFQPSQDDPYVKEMASFLNSDHRRLECSAQRQAQLLASSVIAHDLPCMADVDSSLLYFCSQVSKYRKVALTGECADEIFGGYPWFFQPECLQSRSFPWTFDLAPRKQLLKDEFAAYLNMEDYVSARYEESVSETPRLESDSPLEAKMRELFYLNQKWFMQTLLNRMDRTSMFSGLETRVPFADHRILEYVWNIPWKIKSKNGIAKYLLRECGAGYLPDSIRLRRKSPYPKTYDAGYQILLSKMLRQIMEDSQAPIWNLIDSKKLERFLSAPVNTARPWYGQLMAGPQLLAYVWQINYWLTTYQVRIITS